jgi:predicted acylesterase/phospholipase RssA
VAASACVPGLFRPVVLKGLYPKKVVRLVDGGVRDNQGVYGLLEQDCNVMLVSDASGQMDDEDDPAWLFTGVLKRSNDVLMATVRTSFYRELDAARRASRLRELLFVHLKKGLEVRDVDWERAGPAPGTACAAREAPHDENERTEYGIPKELQRQLAALRTDLDDFSREESYALMLSGYRMVEAEAPRELRSLPLSRAPRADWPFLELEDVLQPASEAQRRRYRELVETLRVGRHRTLRRARRALRVVRDRIGL